MPHLHHAPAACPVCAARLVTTRLGCPSCGTELVGSFEPCPFCALDAEDLDLLKVFLISRGNLKELEKHLQVSYPTARARFAAVLNRLGWDDAAAPDGEEQASDQLAGEYRTAEEGAPGEYAADQHGTGEDATDDHASQESAGGQPAGTREGVRDQVLAQVASGVLSPAVAAELLSKLG